MTFIASRSCQNLVGLGYTNLISESIIIIIIVIYTCIIFEVWSHNNTLYYEVMYPQYTYRSLIIYDSQIFGYDGIIVLLGHVKYGMNDSTLWVV